MYPIMPAAKSKCGGQGLVEYGLILGLISILIVTMFVMFNEVSTSGGIAASTLSQEAMGKHGASVSAGLY